MAEIIASIAGLVLVGTTFIVLGYAARTREKEMHRMTFEPVVLQFKRRQRRSVNSSRQ
ncbi:hypothetical protein PY650_01210 [Rhizobium calliandrae]|uniref:Uncharacterized protein n=1 Tax=Rhizobium calliandrae TaxID=1312182 RepID=A0ABT7K6Q6_9HYPH|nr:hypothetical protein [Rhizobium calliandrae]MDL2404296.1 hypothetical protein [Rhizobium calliandrae]